MILDHPPKEWKRPDIPDGVKAKVLLRQKGRCAVMLHKLEAGKIHYDHRPALWERKFDTDAWDTIPPANDPQHIEALAIDAHDKRTHGPGGEKRITTAGSDSGRRAKGKRLDKWIEDFERYCLNRPCGQKRAAKGTIKSRGFDRKPKGSKHGKR